MFPRGIQHMKSIVSEPHFDPICGSNFKCAWVLCGRVRVCVCVRVCGQTSIKKGDGSCFPVDYCGLSLAWCCFAICRSSLNSCQLEEVDLQRGSCGLQTKSWIYCVQLAGFCIKKTQERHPQLHRRALQLKLLKE
jgi:hypothetical protein